MVIGFRTRLLSGLFLASLGFVACGVEREPDVAVDGLSSATNLTELGSSEHTALEGTAPSLMVTLQQAELRAADPGTGDTFGTSVSIDGDTAIVGAPYDNDKGSNSGAAYIFVRAGTQWSQQAKIVPSDSAANDNFGYSVAISGSTVIIGATNHLVRGAAYVYTRNTSTWTLQAKLVSSTSFRFGASVALQQDTAVVGAPDTSVSFPTEGRAYVYTRSGSTWSSAYTLNPQVSASGVQLGYSVATSGDVIAVGAVNRDFAPGDRKGAVDIFVKPTNGWQSTNAVRATLRSTGVVGARFGASVAISTDGATVLVGAPDDNDGLMMEGLAYVYDRPAGGWTSTSVYTARLLPSLRLTGENFGISVALSGSHALVGQYNNTVGTAYLYRRNVGNWEPQTRILGTDGRTSDGEGVSIAMAEDTAIMGAPYHEHTANPADAGAAYIFLYGAIGLACSTGIDCARGYCVNGVCCDSACTGLCQACSAVAKGGGTNGICGNVIPGKTPTPSTQCAANPPCGLDGTCNGGGACRLFGPNTTCGSGTTCSNGQLSGQSCDGFGNCVTKSGQSCAPYASCTGNMCATSCTTDANCTTGNFCLAGKCTEKLNLGLSCAAAAQCKSNFCVDDVCCNTPCSGLCQACTRDLQGGVGDDGYCGNAAADDIPDAECAADLPSSCGHDGYCTAGGQCGLYSYGVECAPSECVSNQVIRHICNGFGSCKVDPLIDDCTPFACTDGACPTSCTADAECVPSAHCVEQPISSGNGGAGGAGGSAGAGGAGGAGGGGGSTATGTCVPKNQIGTSCTAPNDCLSGFCAGGRCCATDCVVDPAKPCGYTGQCNEFGACSLHDYGENCGGSLCAGGLVYETQVCNGLGSCIPNPEKLTTCFPYVCDDDEHCKTVCIEQPEGSSVSDCVEGFQCRAGTCVPVTRTCVSIDDCNAGEVCDAVKGQCVPRPEQTPVDTSTCDCQVPGRSLGQSNSLAAGLALLVVALRRSRRR